MTDEQWDRFLSNIHAEPMSGCWLWVGGMTGGGYGSFYYDGRRVGAHRAAVEHDRGPIAKGLEVDHLCRVRRCVNPAHLESVTSGENKRRSPLVGRYQRLGVARATAGERQAKKTHCAQGHPFADENVRHYRSRRICRACNRVAVEKYHRQNAATIRAADRERRPARYDASIGRMCAVGREAQS